MHKNIDEMHIFIKLLTILELKVSVFDHLLITKKLIIKKLIDCGNTKINKC